MARLPSPACQGFTQMAVSSCTLVGVCVQELLFCRDQEQAYLLLVPHSSFPCYEETRSFQSVFTCSGNHYMTVVLLSLGLVGLC